MGRVDAAAGEQIDEVVRGNRLAREPARVVDARVERLGRSLQPIDAHRRRDIGRSGEPLGAGQREAEQRRRCLGAINERQALLRGEPDRWQSRTP